MKKFICVLIGLLVAVVMSGMATTQPQNNKKESKWVEIQSVEIPAGTPIQEGLTRTGNPKYWIEIGELKVSVSPGSAEKFKKGQTKLVLVKWQSKEDPGEFKYSIRQKKGAKAKTPDMDITKLFK